MDSVYKYFNTFTNQLRFLENSGIEKSKFVRENLISWGWYDVYGRKTKKFPKTIYKFLQSKFSRLFKIEPDMSSLFNIKLAIQYKLLIKGYKKKDIAIPRKVLANYKASLIQAKRGESNKFKGNMKILVECFKQAEKSQKEKKMVKKKVTKKKVVEKKSTKTKKVDKVNKINRRNIIAELLLKRKYTDETISEMAITKGCEPRQCQQHNITGLRRTFNTMGKLGSIELTGGDILKIESGESKKVVKKETSKKKEKAPKEIKKIKKTKKIKKLKKVKS